jgi:tetratricopeptide (TPR) repeat protein
MYAEAERNLRNYGIAHNHLVRASELEPRETEFLYADILVCWAVRDIPALRHALRKTREITGNNDVTRKFECLARTSVPATTTEAAEKNLRMLQDAVRHLGPDPELMNALGDAYLALGLLDEALSWFDKVLQVNSDHEEARLGAIAALEAQVADASAKDRDSVIDELGAAYDAYLERWDDNFAIRKDRALFRVRTCDYDKAAADLEILLMREPKNPHLRRNLAYVYRKTGRYREAAVFLRSLLQEEIGLRREGRISHAPEIPLLIEYAGCLERSGAPDIAEKVLKSAHDFFGALPAPGQTASAKKGHPADISLALGLLYLRRKQIPTACDYLNEAARANPDDARPWHWLSMAAKATKKKGAGMQDPRYYEAEASKRQ